MKTWIEIIGVLFYIGALDRNRLCSDLLWGFEVREYVQAFKQDKEREQR